jgi:FMN phosphatase YigB (HAD superfamily)
VGGLARGTAFQRLHADGWLVGVAANQPAYAEAPLRAALPGLDLVGLSAVWGVEKPAPGFFKRVIKRARLPASRIVFVGDRLDNDVLPAQGAGMMGVHLRRGPWGFRDAGSARAAAADLRIDVLDELPDLVGELVRESAEAARSSESTLAWRGDLLPGSPGRLILDE